MASVPTAIAVKQNVYILSSPFKIQPNEREKQSTKLLFVDVNIWHCNFFSKIVLTVYRIPMPINRLKLRVDSLRTWLQGASSTTPNTQNKITKLNHSCMKSCRIIYSESNFHPIHTYTRVTRPATMEHYQVTICGQHVFKIYISRKTAISNSSLIHF